MYKIDKGIKRSMRQAPMWARSYPWHEMDIGDSFFIPEGTVAHPYGVISMPNKYYDKKFACSKVKGGHRIWRIK